MLCVCCLYIEEWCSVSESFFICTEISGYQLENRSAVWAAISHMPETEAETRCLHCLIFISLFKAQGLLRKLPVLNKVINILLALQTWLFLISTLCACILLFSQLFRAAFQDTQKCASTLWKWEMNLDSDRWGIRNDSHASFLFLFIFLLVIFFWFALFLL